jgi:UDP-N-acetylglucosamine 2-epimerase (non-hydrolysing)
MEPMRYKIVIVVGTRPEVIKLAPVIQQLQQKPCFSVKVIGTGQQKDLLYKDLELFGIHLDHALDVMVPNQSLGALSSRLMSQLDPVISQESPHLLITQGDTTTTFVASLIGFYHKVKVAHVEAGLRSHRKYHPFPEELNRKLVSHLADLFFAPTEGAMQNLLKENIEPAQIFHVGNTVVDALQYILDKIPWNRRAYWEEKIQGQRLVIMTAHRRESLGIPLGKICLALRKLATAFPDVKFLFPVHPNPQVQQTVHDSLDGCEGILLTESLPYAELVHLLQRAEFVMTDSGGLQEEASVLGKPVLVLREVTERPEGVAAGIATCVGADEEKIIMEASRLLITPETHKDFWIYGDGKASERIAAIVEGLFRA